ncbi:MAG: HsdR family type I site-specific deoxyribonuclease [Planctomycetes bacterium]|uniref:HsdR family type I site-specific deoxyribonuclease n=1 Tax=Candidatus Wunengus californicus TaxID=3367619 RepID=UPI004027D30E|nr:HsdR family type I site-specific deoxyribonuclease [Planctomycetota bacterium]
MSIYTESNLIELPAIELFNSLGYTHQNCFHETFGEKGTLGRATSTDVVLIPKLKEALINLNPSLPVEAINQAIEELTRDRSILNPITANREVYKLIKDGVKVHVNTLTQSLSQEERASEEAVETVRVIDWNNPENNDFFLASQFWITGEMYKRRADLVGFVNGLPLIFIELKAVHKKLEDAFRDNITDYKDTIPQIFWYNAFVILSNGSESRIGTISADFEHFSEWKKINSEGEEGIVSLETIIKGTCEKCRFLDLLENFILYKDSGGSLIKIIAKNHQYLGVNSAISAFHRYLTYTQTLTPNPSPRGRGESPNYRGGFTFSGLVQKTRELRLKQTNAEQIVWEMLRDGQFLGLKFRRQHQIGEYIADFYCHEKLLVVEIDGSIHIKEEVRKKDHKRDSYFQSLGLKVIRFSNETILNDPEKFLTDLAVFIENLPSPSGESTEIIGHHPPSPSGRRNEDEGAASRRLGVFWHTQGSGKSFSMIFFSQKILRKFEGNYTFLIVTDRKELDEQIYKNFASVGAVTEQEVHAESGEHLGQLLKENHRNIFTLIHKFIEINTKVSDRSDIIVITDESHRTQYDTLAMNMRTALPNAAFIAFTGTPLIVGEELTRKTFGDYVSIYNFKQSIDDKATVPLYYENRIPEVQLKNEYLNEDIEQIIEEAMLSPEQEEKLQREFAREYHIITRNDRLEKIAEDIVAHYANRGYQGKAMVVSIDKPTAVKMYDKVQKYWNKYINELNAKLKESVENREEAEKRLLYMQETDMAVVVSGEQNEIEKFRKLGLDIEKHRRRMVKEDLAEKFKDPANPFRIVFVCAMWMTGFDVPCLSTIYLDKPMRNHTLMQTIARANRVFGDKTNGLIVDYAGVFRELQKALAIYGSGSGGGIKEGENPVKEKDELIKELEKAIEETEGFCKERGINIQRIISSDKLEKIKLITDAVDAILVNDESKRRYLTLSSQVSKLFKAILPDPQANRFYEKCAVFTVLADKIKSVSGEVDIANVTGKVEQLLDESIEAEGYVIREPHEPHGDHIIDLSQIDFETLRKKFLEGRKNTQIARIKAAIQSKLNRMVRFNRSRVDFLEKFQQLIEEYNSGAINIELFFDRLLTFVKRLNEEEKRGIEENLTEEELALFDLLKKPDMTRKETKQVKLASKELLGKLKKEKLVIDWRRKQQARADVLLTIQMILDAKLPRSYTPELYEQKCVSVFQHIYDSYFGAGKSVYTTAA